MVIETRGSEQTSDLVVMNSKVLGDDLCIKSVLGGMFGFSKTF